MNENDYHEERHFRRDAINGSRKLLLAILHSQGIYLAKRPKRKPYKAIEQGKKYPPNPEIAPIEAVVAEYYRIDRDHIHIARRHRWCARPRQVCMYLAHTVAGVSLPKIARHFGRDHTTVLHACRAVPANGQLAVDAQAIKAMLVSPVDFGDMPTISKNLAANDSRTNAEQKQDERLAA